MPISSLTFSALLQRDLYDSLRVQLAKPFDTLAAGADSLDGVSVFVTTIYECLAKDQTVKREAGMHVLLGLTDIVVIRRESVSSCSECAVHHALDGREYLTPDYIDQLTAGAYRFQGGPSSIDLLGAVLHEAPENGILHLDLQTDEVSYAQTLVHPRCTLHDDTSPRETVFNPRQGDSVPADPAHLRVVPAIELRSADDQVGPSLRRPSSRPDTSGLKNAYAGLIRREFVKHGRGGTVTAMAQSSRREGEERMPVQVFTGGTRSDVGTAQFVARCEALERYSLLPHVSMPRIGPASYRDVKDRAVSPASLQFDQVYTPHAEQERRAFDEDVRMYWTPAESLADASEKLVPAQQVWMNTREWQGESLCIQTTTNGCAIGSSVEEATVHALLELIERDAVLSAWINQRACRPIDPDSFSDPRIKQLQAHLAFTRPAYAITFFDATPASGCPVVWAVAVNRDNGEPRTYHTAGGGISAEDAAWSALVEQASRLEHHSDFHDNKDRYRRIRTDPERTHTIRDHSGVAGLREAFHRFDFLPFDADGISAHEINAACPVPVSDTYRLSEVRQQIVDALRETGASPYRVDVTPPGYTERGVHSVKAVVPGLLPIRFGWKNRVRRDRTKNPYLHPFS